MHASLFLNRIVSIAFVCKYFFAQALPNLMAVVSPILKCGRTSCMEARSSPKCFVCVACDAHITWTESVPAAEIIEDTEITQLIAEGHGRGGPPLFCHRCAGYVEKAQKEIRSIECALELVSTAPLCTGAQNNCQRQAMMFFIIGVAIGFVVPLGRDVRWAESSVGMLVLALIFILVTSISRNPNKAYARRSRKRRFLHARRPGVAQLQQIRSPRKSRRVCRILATVCFLPVVVLVCLCCLATFWPLLTISTLALKLCRWMYRVSCFVCICMTSVVISGSGSTCLKAAVEKADELCEVLGESSYYCWQLFCLAPYIGYGSKVIRRLWSCACLGLWFIHVVLLLFAIRLYVILLIVGAYVHWLPWVLYCYYTIWVSVKLPLTIFLACGVRSFLGCARCCINANGYILRLVILWTQRLCFRIVEQLAQADVLFLLASLVSVLGSPLGKFSAKCLVMLFIVSFHLPLIHCRMLSIFSSWILLYSLPFINEENILRFALVLLCGIWLWFHPSFPAPTPNNNGLSSLAQDGMDEPLFGDHDDSDEDKTAGNPSIQSSHPPLSVPAASSNRVTDDLTQRRQI